MPAGRLEVVWVKRLHTSYPAIYPGWQYVSAAEKSALITAQCAQDVKTVPQRYLDYRDRRAPVTP